MIARGRRVRLLAFCMIAVWGCATYAFPTAPITLIVPNPAGGPTDTLVRAVAAKMSETLKQTVIVDNRSGGGGIIATQYVNRAQADGHTVGIVYLSHATNLHVRHDLPYDTLTSFRPVILLAKGSLVLIVNSKLPANSVSNLIAYAKANPSKLNYGASGLGGASHLAGALFKELAGVDIAIVPYKGASTLLPDLISGRIDLTISGYQQYVPHIKSGAVRALGVSTSEAFEAAPDLPSIAKTVSGFEVTAWYGAIVPAATPPDIVAKLNSEFAKALADEKVSNKIRGLGLTPGGGPESAFGTLVESEVKKWGPIVVKAGLVQK